MIKLVIVDLNFPDWIPILQKNDKIVIINNKYINDYLSDEYKFIPISIDNCIKFSNLNNNIFKNNIKNIYILNNKSKFGKYMLDNFIDNTPTIFYYNYDNQTYIKSLNKSIINSHNKFIIKPNEGNCGYNIKIVNKIIPKENHIIQEYIDHTIQYVGHFLVFNGIIIKKVYFFSNHLANEIKKGRIMNYQVLENLNLDDSIFDKIFTNLNYSGFADSDFTIINNKILIFEINPRPGGSLIHNEKYFNLFIEILDKIINNSL